MVLIFAQLCAVLCGVRGEGVSWIVKIIRLRAGGGSFPFLPRIPTVSLPWRSFASRSTGNANIGKSSLYRQLSALCDEETVRKFRNEERGCSVYQYIGGSCSCRDCFHAKCLRCGRLEHLDCGDSVVFARHLMAEHGFAIDCGQSVLYGICRKCLKKTEGKRLG